MGDFVSPMIVTPKRRRWYQRWWVIVTLVVVLLALLGVGGGLYLNSWYKNALTPASNEEKRIRVTVPVGSNTGQIGDILQEAGVIKSARAFSRYVDGSPHRGRLQAGTYLLSPHRTVQEIVEILAEGKVDNFKLTLVPGKRLDQITASLEKAGFAKTDILAALTKGYSHPLLADKPAASDLEGYIFPDTYELDSQATPEKLLTTTFDTFWKYIQDEGLVEPLKKQGLNTFQAITLASIVQQEVTGYEDQQKVAQVFLKRLKQNISLGADPTFRYASRKAGVEDSITIDSPYNTRIYKGLPPGPIGNFNISALRAVANPAPTDFLYFVAGDDGVTRFSKTQAEHEALTAKYCIKLCQQ